MLNVLDFVSCIVLPGIVYNLEVYQLYLSVEKEWSQ